VNSDDILEALYEPSMQILEAVFSVLEKTPPELSADIADRGIYMTGGGCLVYGFDKLIKSKSSTDISKDNNAIQNNNKYLDFSKKYNNNEMVNQSRISSQNISVMNNDCPNDNVIVFQSQNLQRLNNLTLNKNESQVLSIINSNKISDNSKQTTNNSGNVSKTLNNFFNDKIQKNQGIKQMNKLIKSSSMECLSQKSENGRIIKRMEEISNFYVNKNKKVLNNELIIPIIKDIKIRKMNFDINKIKFKNENNAINPINKKNNFIDISPKKNCITINRENNIKAVLNNDSNNNVFIKKYQNNKIKKIKFKNLI
jgi:hypothetical protein